MKSSSLSPRAAAAILAERKAKNDTLAWIQLYRPKILLRDGREVDFEPYEYQQFYIRALDAGGPVLANKARQIGISTATMVQKARRMIEQPGLVIPVISRKEKLAAELIEIAKRAYQTCRKRIKPGIENDSTFHFRLANGSRLIAEAASENAARAYPASEIVFDEFAFCAWQEEMWRSVRPAVDDGANIAVISTPNGEGDRFEELWTQHTGRPGAGEGEISVPGSRWKAFRLPWWVHPHRAEAWKEQESSDYTDADWRQEYECDFLSAAEAVFRAEDIQVCVELDVPVSRTRTPGHCILAVDVAGEGRDETVILVLDVQAKPYFIIEIKHFERIASGRLQDIIEQTAREHNADVVIDATGLGWGVSENLGIQHDRITFTGGKTVNRDGRSWSIGRSQLISNSVQVIEKHEIALDRRHQELITALRTARYDKREGSYVDWLDSLLMALWMAERASRGSGGIVASGTPYVAEY